MPLQPVPTSDTSQTRQTATMQLRHSAYKFIKHNSLLGTHHHFRGIYRETQPSRLYHTKQLSHSSKGTLLCGCNCRSHTWSSVTSSIYPWKNDVGINTHTNTCLNFVEGKPDKFTSKIIGKWARITLMWDILF